jgi:hypothetical protein
LARIELRDAKLSKKKVARGSDNATRDDDDDDDNKDDERVVTCEGVFAVLRGYYVYAIVSFFRAVLISNDDTNANTAK